MNTTPCSPPQDQYIYRGDGVYLSHSAKNYKAQIEKNVIVGPESTLGRESTVRDSVIGTKCEIKSGCVIRNSHIWDEVTIERNCTIDGAVLCSGVTVKEGTVITPDCILSYDTTVGPNITLKRGTRVFYHSRVNICHSLLLLVTHHVSWPCMCHGLTDGELTIPVFGFVCSSLILAY